MRINRLIGYLVFFLVDIGICHAQKALTPDESQKMDRFQKLMRKFKYSRNKFRQRRDFSLVDTNAVYLSSYYDETTKKMLYIFMRFFANGAVYSSRSYASEPSPEELAMVNYGRWEMWITRKGEVLVERYIRNSMRHFEYEYGKLNGDRLTFYKYKIGKAPRGKVEHADLGTYRKKPFRFTNHDIPWKW